MIKREKRLARRQKAPRFLAKVSFLFSSLFQKEQGFKAKFVSSSGLLRKTRYNSKMSLGQQLIYKSSSSVLERHRQWVRFLQGIRSHFQHKGFEECITPVMVVSPGTEPSIDLFEFTTRIESENQKRYLRTSPEISIKKLICMGMGDCFEIAPVFRDKEWTDHHRPEFMMLEWYRREKKLAQIQTDVCDLILSLCPGKNIQFQSFSVAELFQKELNLSITPKTTLEDYRLFCEKLNLDHQSMTTIDDYFFLIWTTLIEPKFNSEQVIFVKDYPPFQKAYSKIDPQSGWAQRMEFYWKGFELGNAFDEETDFQEQKKQFESDNQKKRQSGKPEVAIDQEFLSLMSQMPQCAGIAVGLDRLFLCIQ